MARANFTLPTDFMDALSKLEKRTDEIVPKVLQAGGEVVLEHVRVRLKAVLSGTSTGELARALGISPARLDRRGNYDVKVGFAESRSDGKSNAMLANVLEHGTSTQPARPFLRPARRKAKQPAIDAMTAALEKELQNL